MDRRITYTEALNEALQEEMQRDRSVYVRGASKRLVTADVGAEVGHWVERRSLRDLVDSASGGATAE